MINNPPGQPTRSSTHIIENPASAMIEIVNGLCDHEPSEAHKSGVDSRGNTGLCDETLQGFGAETELGVARLNQAFEPYIEAQSTSQNSLTEKRTTLESKPLASGAFLATCFKCVVLFVALLALGIVDTAVNANGTALFGVREENMRYLVSGGLVLTSTLCFERALAQGGNLLVRFVYLAITLMILAPLSICRYNYFVAIELGRLGSKLISEVVEACGVFLPILYAGVTAGLTLALAYLFESSCEAFHGLLRAYQLKTVERDLERSKLSIAVATAQRTRLSEVLRRLEDVRRSHYRQGLAVEWLRTEPQQTSRFAAWGRKLLAAAGMLLVAFVLVMTTGCGGRHSVVLVTDISGSTELTDDDCLRIAEGVACRMPKNSELAIIPVNGKVGDPVIVEFPANDPTGLGEVYAAKAQEVRDQLRSKLPLWRASASGSDIRSAYVFAAERFRGASKKTAIVLSDMIHVASPNDTGQAGGVPMLDDVALNGAQIYLGFVHTRTKGPSISVLQKRWIEELKETGADEIEPAVFGLDSVNRFLDLRLGTKRDNDTPPK